MENQAATHSTNRKPLLLGVVVLLVLILLGAWLIMSHRTSNTSQETTATVPQKEAQVTITKNGFVPATLLVKKGTVVTWKNDDVALHRVASDPYPSNTGLPGLDSLDPLHQNDTYSFTFEKTGKFGYHDNLNPYKLQGTIIVE